MKNLVVFLLLCSTILAAHAQRVSRSYKDVPMSKVLIDLRRATDRYKIVFIHNELEDYTITKHFEQLTVPEAIRECIGFYPIIMKTEGDSLIFVEAMQKTEGKLIGRLINNKKQPVTYANITLLNTGDSAIVSSGVSNENGDFVIPTKERRLQIRISCIGYETQVLNCETGDIGTIVLKETTEHISEVVVVGSSHLTEQDKDVYIPNQRQRNAANSGLDLLENLMIPQLNINRMTGEVKSTTNKAITFAIDERIVEREELKEIRPKDVLRVEYIDMPSGKFADKELVIRFVLRHYDYGGYVEAGSYTRFLHSLGENNIRACIDHKKMSYTLLIGSDYENERGASNENEEDLIIDKTFHMATTSQYEHIKEWTNYGVFRARYHTDRLTLTASAGITKNHTPEYGYTENLDYCGDVTGRTTAKSTIASQNTSIYFRAGADWNLTDRQQLAFDIRFSFGRNSYDNTYHESDGYDIISLTKEKTTSIIGDISYVNHFNQQHSITLRVIEFYQHYHDEYRGSLSADQHPTESETIIWPIYVYRPNSKWMFNFRPLGFSVAYWKTPTSSQTYLSSRGSFYIKNQLNSQNSLMYGVYFGNSNPNAAIRSEVEQIVSRYEVLRGNPNLKKTIFSTLFVNYNLTLKNWQLTAYAEYERLGQMIRDIYTPEDGRLVHSYTNDGTLHDLSLNVQQTLFLLNRNLQLKGGVKLERNILTGAHGATLNHINCNLNVRYHLGDFSLSAFYEPPQYYLKQEFITTDTDYGISATYGRKGFYAEVGARRLFLHDVTEHHYFRNYGHYAYDNYERRDRNNPWLYLKLSYSFDFGRKSSRQEIEAGSTSGTAILHK